MMFLSFQKVIYKFILDAEMSLLFEFKLNSLDFLNNISILDLQSYMTRITERKQQLDKAKMSGSSKDSFAKSLIAIRDILNYMTGNF